MGRGAVGSPVERLQLLDSRRARAGARWRRIDAEIEAWPGFRIVLGTRQRPDDVEQLFFGEPDQRSPQQRAEREACRAGRQARGSGRSGPGSPGDGRGPCRPGSRPGCRDARAPPHSATGRCRSAPEGRCRRAGKAECVPLRRSRIIWLPIRRAHISATASASASRCCSALALPFSSATATSSAATHRASPRSSWKGSSAVKPGWPSLESTVSKRSFT